MKKYLRFDENGHQTGMTTAPQSPGSNWHIAPENFDGKRRCVLDGGTARLMTDTEISVVEDKKQRAAFQSVKDEAIHRIAEKANTYQNKIIGTDDPSRAKRFEVNLVAAKALLAGIATEAQTSMLQLQLDANKYAEHPVLKDATLDEFARWIADYDELTTKAIGLIENTLIVGRAKVEKAVSESEINTIIEQLAEQAEQQFSELVN